jgi:hypothetical protein
MEPIVEQAVPIMQRHALILQLIVEEYLDEGEQLNTLSVKKLWEALEAITEGLDEDALICQEAMGKANKASCPTSNQALIGKTYNYSVATSLRIHSFQQLLYLVPWGCFIIPLFWAWGLISLRICVMLILDYEGYIEC